MNVQRAGRAPVTAPRAPRAEPQRERRVAVPVARDPLPPPIVPKVQIARAQPAAAPETPNVRVQSEQRAPLPPRIEVTIGTVEVRAVAAPTPPPPVVRATREPPPSVSLNDYLKQRGSSRP
jgi:hypothetical protein